MLWWRAGGGWSERSHHWRKDAVGKGKSHAPHGSTTTNHSCSMQMNSTWHSTKDGQRTFTRICLIVYWMVMMMRFFTCLFLQAREYLISIDPVNKTYTRDHSELFICARPGRCQALFHPWKLHSGWAQYMHTCMRTVMNVLQILYMYDTKFLLQPFWQRFLCLLIVDPPGINWWPHDPLGW